MKKKFFYVIQAFKIILCYQIHTHKRTYMHNGPVLGWSVRSSLLWWQWVCCYCDGMVRKGSFRSFHQFEIQKMRNMSWAFIEKMPNRLSAESKMGSNGTIHQYRSDQKRYENTNNSIKSFLMICRGKFSISGRKYDIISSSILKEFP